MRDDNQLIVRPRRRLAPRQFARLTEQCLDQSFRHLNDIVLAFAQVGIFKFIKLRDQNFHLLHQRPFGVAPAFANQIARCFDQRRIFQNHRMQIDKRRDLGQRTGQAGFFA